MSEDCKENTETSPAFNVSDALGRLMNNKALYKKLLDKFKESYESYDEKVVEAFNSGSFDEAVHLSHTMKGLAGNLGATALQEASLTLELIARGAERTTELDAALKKFVFELQRALQEVRNGVDMG
ncbi:MAG: Hpt domain-containing protein [Synergistaceae bacterium]|nr:Hpt domain-containing protein [Synergistaceae bacterium]